MIQPIKVDEGIFRGPQPVTIEDWQTLAKLGIKATLNLESGSHLLADGEPLREMFQAEAYGIRVIAHPLGEIFPPTQGELRLAYRAICSFKPIYVHCKKGVDRTGMVIGDYQATIGICDKPEAIKRMKKAGMHFWFYWWTWFL